MNKKIVVIKYITLIIVLLLIGIGIGGYRLLWAPNFMPEKTVYVYIDRQKDFEDLCTQLKDSAACLHIKNFKQLAKILKYPSNMKTGRYAVTPGMNNLFVKKPSQGATGYNAYYI